MYSKKEELQGGNGVALRGNEAVVKAFGAAPLVNEAASWVMCQRQWLMKQPKLI